MQKDKKLSTVDKEILERSKMLMPITDMIQMLREIKDMFPTLNSLPNRMTASE